MARFWGVYLLYLIIGLVIFFIVKTKNKSTRRYYMVSLIVGLTALLIRKIVALFIHIPRPEVSYGFDSFPSGHASFLFGIAWFIFFENKKIGLLFLCLAIINGLARIILNYHYPIDIFGGALLGLLIAYMIKKLAW